MVEAVEFESNHQGIVESEFLCELCLNDTHFGDEVAELLAKGLKEHRSLKRLQVCG